MIKLDNFTKSILYRASKSIIFFLCIYLVYGLLSKQGLFPLLLTILGATMFKDVWKILVPNSKKYVKSLAIVFMVIFTSIYFMRWGIIGFFIVVLGLAGWKIWRGWDMYIDGIRNVETQIWGEPLDKKGCSKNETAVPKMKQEVKNDKCKE